jgi:anti-sigma regulatory factor (Ser/Thr protein kinase)
MVSLPQRGVVSRVIFASEARTPSLARQHAGAELRNWKLPSEIADAAVLLVSELTTNAVNASVVSPANSGGTQGEVVSKVSLVLRLLWDRLVIEVSDDAPYPPVQAVADTESENGRGLLLVEALSKEWGYFRLPSGGKTVFCVLGLPCGASGAGSGHAR